MRGDKTDEHVLHLKLPAWLRQLVHLDADLHHRAMTAQVHLVLEEHYKGPRYLRIAVQAQEAMQ